MLSPGCGARSSNTGAPRSVTKRAFLAYPSAFQVCADISGTSYFSNCTQCQWKRYEPAMNGGKNRVPFTLLDTWLRFHISDKPTICPSGCINTAAVYGAVENCRICSRATT